MGVYIELFDPLPPILKKKIVRSPTNMVSTKNILYEHIVEHSRYVFIEDFQKNNRALMPHDNLYLCDPRYLDTLGLTAAGQEYRDEQIELSSQRQLVIKNRPFVLG